MRLPPLSTKACSFAGGIVCEVIREPTPAMSPFSLIESRERRGPTHRRVDDHAVQVAHAVGRVPYKRVGISIPDGRRSADNDARVINRTGLTCCSAGQEAKALHPRLGRVEESLAVGIADDQDESLMRVAVACVRRDPSAPRLTIGPGAVQRKAYLVPPMTPSALPVT